MNTILIIAMVGIFLLFVAALVFAIIPELWLKFTSGWPSKLYQNIRKQLPDIMFAQEQTMKEMAKDWNESRKRFLTLNLIRVFSIIIAIGTGGFLLVFFLVLTK
jgi:hypothetical protein